MTLQLIKGDGRQRPITPAQGAEGSLLGEAPAPVVILPKRGIPMPKLAHKLAKGEALNGGERIFLLKVLLAWMLEQDIDAESPEQRHGAQRTGADLSDPAPVARQAPEPRT